MRVAVAATRSAGRMLDELIVFIRSHPGLAERLLAEHIDDGTGRCRSCANGGQTGRCHWPCTLHSHARRAIDGPAGRRR